ncbi:MAG: hypothetical protein IJD97_09770 [Clostridia bacterium]|nr:hypothetical protein [Clostridia bacterium]
MKKITALTLIALLVLALLPVCAASGTLPVIKAEFPVIVNGRVVENKSREYPFILCNSITYFPMTYEDCAFLGLSNNWTAESGNVIEKAAPSGIYKDFVDPAFSYMKKGETATVVTTPITVLGVRINNAAETYPILNYKNVLYFPLTWDWGQKFGWNINFSEDKKLEVTTEGFEDAGFFYSYRISGSEVIRETNKLSDTSADSILYGGYNFSPDYDWGIRKTEGLVQLFRLTTEMEAERIISIRESEVQNFLSKGWYRLEDAKTAVYEFIKTHSSGELYTATEGLMYGDLYSIFGPVRDEIIGNYTTLYYGNNTCMMVPNSEVYAHTAAGWMKADDYAIDVVNYLESRKDYGAAMTALEKNMSILQEDIPGHPYPDFSEFDYSLAEELYQGIRERYASYMNGNIAFRTSVFGGYTPFMIVDCVLPKGKHLVSFDISYDVVDSAGNVLYNVDTTQLVYLADFNIGKTAVKSAQIYLDEIENPYAVGIANVRFSNLVYDDLYNMPMGQG